MRDSSGFDQWADEYESFVSASESEDSYPFAGYRKVHDGIFREVISIPGAAVLDIGFGTGVLTSRLYGQGCRIFGQDFSARMIELASEKMPDAELYRGDFSQGLAEPLLQHRYDFIIATYSLHHLNDDQKVSLLSQLLGMLKDDGRIMIGDVAFETRSQMERCREEAGESWDDDEYYFVYDELKKAFPGLTFDPKSKCAGILTLMKKRDS